MPTVDSTLTYIAAAWADSPDWQTAGNAAQLAVLAACALRGGTAWLGAARAVAEPHGANAGRSRRTMPCRAQDRRRLATAAPDAHV